MLNGIQYTMTTLISGRRGSVKPHNDIVASTLANIHVSIDDVHPSVQTDFHPKSAGVLGQRTHRARHGVGAHIEDAKGIRLCDDGAELLLALRLWCGCLSP